VPPVTIVNNGLDLGADFVSACIFCASLLLRQELPPVVRTSGDLSASYHTLDRDAREGNDHSDVTAKTVSGSFRWARLGRSGLGAGTPPSELRLAATFPSVHDDAAERRAGTSSATGNGRMENYLLLGRCPLFGEHDSAEAAVQQRRLVIADLVTFDSGTAPSERRLEAERYDLTLGWRHRFRGAELAGRAAFLDVNGKHQTLSRRVAMNGNMWGGGLEARAAAGPFVLELFGEAAAGKLFGAQVSASASTSLASRAWIETGGGSVTLTTGAWDFRAGIAYQSWRLPFVVIAVLGSETRALDAGLLPDARVDAWVVDFVSRRRLRGGVAARFFFRTILGSETVRFGDRATGSHTSTDVRLGHGDILPGAFTLGFGLEVGPSVTP
jgi:hypothetical protein